MIFMNFELLLFYTESNPPSIIVTHQEIPHFHFNKIEHLNPSCIQQPFNILSLSPTRSQRLYFYIWIPTHQGIPGNEIVNMAAQVEADTTLKV